MSLIRAVLRSLGAIAVALAFAQPSWGQLVPMSEQELSATNAQGLLELSNSNYGGFDFSRIAIGADVTLNANLRNIRLGEYNAGADIDISALQFGRSDLDDAARLVKITNPYIEFVYRNVGDAATREVVGLRIGFDGISGDIGMNINTLSGSMLVNGGAAGMLDSHTDPNGGVRWNGACTAPCLSFADLQGVRAGDATGASRDFWISMLKTPVQFQAPPGTAQLPDMAQAGFWLNWRDKLTAISGADGRMPPNLPPMR